MSDTKIGARPNLHVTLQVSTYNCLNRSKYNVDFDDLSFNTPYPLVKLFMIKHRDLPLIFSILRASTLARLKDNT